MRVMLGAVALAIAAQGWTGVLHEHPSIQYSTRPATDRVARLNEELVSARRTLARDPRTGYLRSVLEALDVPLESQALVFSKTGVQREFTSPRTPRALYFNESVAVGYVPNAPALEIASHDPQQGVVFYVLDQGASTPTFTRRTSCLACHVSASTMDVPGMIVRNNVVAEDGSILPQFGGNDVDQRTPHPDRWGGYYVTIDTLSQAYQQRAHAGNITTGSRGTTSNQIFVDWMNSEPEQRGYLSPLSDIASLLVFDHQMHGINLITRLNWDVRVGASAGQVRALADELADYLLFVGEQPPSVPVTPRPGFAEHLAKRIPKDRRGRSLADLDLTNRLLRYPCSYLIYTEAFDGLPAAAKSAVYRRMLDTLSSVRVRPVDRDAVLEILRDTKSDFPKS